MRQIARVVERLIDALGYDAVDVLGYSFGGAVAQELAFRAPAKVRRLLLCATTPGVPAVPPRPTVIAMMLTPARYYSRGLGAFIVPRIAGGRTARDHTVMAGGLAQRQQHPPSLLGYAFQMSAITGWSSHCFLHRITAETLVLHGDDDPIAPLINARWMARRIPNAHLRVLGGCGHLFLLDESEAAVEDIRSFLDEPHRPNDVAHDPRRTSR
jgi:pimeloyl-ACP methyl ester carboxylesterase